VKKATLIDDQVDIEKSVPKDCGVVKSLCVNHSIPITLVSGVIATEFKIVIIFHADIISVFPPVRIDANDRTVFLAFETRFGAEQKITVPL
jgi:hypothetical protein